MGMRYVVGLCLVLAGCSSSPTAPTPTASTPPVVTPAPVVSTPPTPAPNPLLSDPRFSLSFYRMFVNGSLDGALQPLRRQTQAPRIYLRTVDDAGAPIDAFTLDATAAALINTTGKLTGVFGLAGMERGTGNRLGQAGWITVQWSDVASDYCGFGVYGGDRITLYPKTPRCGCESGPRIRLRTVKHELGHTLGFRHTDSPDDLMYPVGLTCDIEPSEREIFHARIAYSQPLGSYDPY